MIPLEPSVEGKYFDIGGILKMPTVESVEPGDNSFNINQTIRCRYKFAPLGLLKFGLVVILQSSKIG